MAEEADARLLALIALARRGRSLVKKERNSARLSCAMPSSSASRLTGVGS